MSGPQPTTSTGESIDVELPARTELASTLRLLAASFGADVGFSVDEIDDLKLALNEIFTTAADGMPTDRVAVSFTPGDGRIDVRVRVRSGVPIELDALAATILGSVVDDVDASGDTISFSKSVGEVSR